MNCCKHLPAVVFTWISIAVFVAPRIGADHHAGGNFARQTNSADRWRQALSLGHAEVCRQRRYLLVRPSALCQSAQH